MFHVRYYDQKFTPSRFNGKGGWTIRALNWVRWKLELFIHSLVIRYLARESSLTKGEVKGLLSRFEVEKQADRLEKVADDMGYDVPIIQPASRYQEGRQQSILETFKKHEEGALPPRPVPLDEMAARLGGPRRSRRYSRGHRFTVLEEEGDFVPVPPNDPEWRVTTPSNTPAKGRR